MTREEIVDFLVEHARSQTHRGRLTDADVVVPGGNPGCGDVVTIFLKVDREGERIEQLSFEGEGCTISQAAASVLVGMVQGADLGRIEAMDYNDMVDALGREVVQSRPRCATLALATLKSAVREYRASRLRAESAARTDGRPEGAAPPLAEGRRSAGTGTHGQER